MRGLRSKVDRRLLPGKASNYIKSIEEIQPCDKVILCCRVSGRLQRHAGNLADQEAALRSIVATSGACVADVVGWVGPGNDPTAWLWEAAMLAKQHGAKLLAETTNRFIRHPDYHSCEWPDAQARECDLISLRNATEGLTLVTVLHPGATWREERAYHTKRGQSQKDRRGGRPRKVVPGAMRKQRLRATSKVRWMKWVGMSNRMIAKALGTAESNVRRWGAPFLRCTKPGDGD